VSRTREPSPVTDRFGRLRRRFITAAVTTALILAGCAASRVLDVSWVAPTTSRPKVPLPPDQRLEVRLTGLTVGTRSRARRGRR